MTQKRPNRRRAKLSVTIDPRSPEAGNGGVVPPEATRFRPRESGNPKGRPKGAATKKPRSAAERREAQRILFAGKVGRPPKYRPDHHPEDIVAYFQASLDAIEEPERVESPQGGVKHVQAPVPPPTLAGYAAKIEVARETLWDWGQKHEEFSNALERCKAIQEQVFLQMGALGAYVPSVTIFMLKNLHGWMDRVEQKHTGGAVVLKFDSQDADA